jgi:arylsulfatase A-like enzyme
MQPVLLVVSFILGFVFTRLFRSDGSLKRALVIIPMCLTVIVVGITKVFSGMPSGPVQPPSEQPNIVILLFDAMRGDHVGPDANGHTLTPTIDALAKDGMMYRDVVSTSAWTFPSVVSMLTSKLPNKLGLMQRTLLPDGLITLPDILKENGYYFDELHFLRGTGPKQIFMPFRSFFPVPRFFDEIAYQWGFIATDLYSGDWMEMNEKAEDILKENTDRPLFLYMHYIEPHSPYWTKPYDGKLIDLEKIRLVYYQPIIMRQVLAKRLDRESKLFTDYGLKLIDIHHERYKEGIQTADRATSEMVRMIEKMGMKDNTIIVIIGDHGDGFFEHGKTGHGHNVYDEQVDIPLVIHIPPVFHAELPPQPDGASILDVAPTLLDMLDLHASLPDPDGVSLIRPHAGTDRTRYVMLECEAGDFFWSGIMQGSYKLMINEGLWTGQIDTMLYNIGEDPGETVNLYPQEQLIVDSLALLLKAQLDQTIAPADERLEDLSPAELQRLRALGYVN